MAPKTVKARIRLDLALDADADHEAEVERLLGLGASRLDPGQGSSRDGEVVLADPDGNEFSVMGPG